MVTMSLVPFQFFLSSWSKYENLTEKIWIFADVGGLLFEILQPSFKIVLAYDETVVHVYVLIA
jgi:hypothetical protein